MDERGEFTLKNTCLNPSFPEKDCGKDKFSIIHKITICNPLLAPEEIGKT